MIIKNHILALFLMCNVSFASAQTWNIEDLHICNVIDQKKLNTIKQAPDDVYIHGDSITFKAKTVETYEITTKWEKRSADRNCISNNPDDCLVWCLAEIRTPTGIRKITASTHALTDIENINGVWLNPDVLKLVQYKVLCNDAITDKIKTAVAEALQSEDVYRNRYPLESEEYYLKYCMTNLQNALKKYQANQKFRVCNEFDLQSLIALGVVVE
jgi:hypothetical protein